MLASKRAGGGCTALSKRLGALGAGLAGADAAKRSEKEKAGGAPLLLKMDRPKVLPPEVVGGLPS